MPDPEAIINQIVSGQFFEAILTVYTSTFGNYFWGLMFFVTSIGVFMRSRSLGLLLFYSLTFSALLVAGNLLPLEFHRFAYALTALCIASLIYWVFGGKE